MHTFFGKLCVSVTGFLVNDVAEAVKALEAVQSILTFACRGRVEESQKTMQLLEVRNG
jgi:hypothetical protein